MEEFLAGAHDMDKHFVDTNPRHNLPVLLALADVWNDTLLGTSTRVINPFSESMSGYPAFVAALEAQTCGHQGSSAASGHSPLGVPETSLNRPTCCSLVVDGGMDCIYDRSIYQSQRMVNSEIVAVMDNQVHFNTVRVMGSSSMEDVHLAQDAVMCSLFAHCDELAFGSERNDGGSVLSSSSYSASAGSVHRSVDTEASSEGNRPSMLLMAGKLDAFACGQLVALAEHRAVVKARIWGIDPFVRELGSSLRAGRAETIKEELHNLFTNKKQEEDPPTVVGGSNLGLSTKTLLEHYATLMQEARIKS